MKLEGMDGQISVAGSDGKRVAATKIDWHLEGRPLVDATVFGESVTYTIPVDWAAMIRFQLRAVALPTLLAIMKRKRQRPLFPATRHRRS